MVVTRLWTCLSQPSHNHVTTLQVLCTEVFRLVEGIAQFHVDARSNNNRLLLLSGLTEVYIAVDSQSSWNIWLLSFKVYSKWSVQASKQVSKQTYTHVHNEVTLVWGLLRLAPINSPTKCHMSIHQTTWLSDDCHMTDLSEEVLFEMLIRAPLYVWETKQTHSQNCSNIRVGIKNHLTMDLSYWASIGGLVYM